MSKKDIFEMFTTIVMWEKSFTLVTDSQKQLIIAVVWNPYSYLKEVLKVQEKFFLHPNPRTTEFCPCTQMKDLCFFQGPGINTLAPFLYLVHWTDKERNCNKLSLRMILLFLFGKMTNLLRTDQVWFMGHFPKGRWFKLEKMERKGISAWRNWPRTRPDL